MSQAITAAQIPAIAERLPPFPRVVPELLDSLQSDTLSVDNLVRIARNDSVIAAAILSGANGLRRLRAQPDTADLFAAASLIGTNKLKQIIVKLGLNKLLSEGSGQAFFYEHSLAVAIVAQELAQLVPGVSADEAYIAGILHDIGQLAYFVVDAEAHRRIRQQAIGDGKLLALEAAAFGLDHCALGVLLGSHWQLPPVILQAIQGHHDTGGEWTNKLQAVVNLAETLTRAFDIPMSPHNRVLSLNAAALDYLGLNWAMPEMADLIGRCRARFAYAGN